MNHDTLFFLAIVGVLHAEIVFAWLVWVAILRIRQFIWERKYLKEMSRELDRRWSNELPEESLEEEPQSSQSLAELDLSGLRSRTQKVQLLPLEKPALVSTGEHPLVDLSICDKIAQDTEELLRRVTGNL
jgi:hypothetical protein